MSLKNIALRTIILFAAVLLALPGLAALNIETDSAPAMLAQGRVDEAIAALRSQIASIAE